MIADFVEDDDAGYWVAEESGQIIGIANVKISSAPPFPVFVPRKYALLENIVVAKAHRSAGIGSGLFRAVVEWCARRGIDRIELSVWFKNRRALRFFERLGFVHELVRLELDLRTLGHGR